MTASSATEWALAAASSGDAVGAAHLLQAAADGGDADAALLLASWRLSGDIIRRDLDKARDLFGRAAALGSDEAAKIHIAMLASGPGGSGRRWSEALRLLELRGVRDASASLERALIADMDIDAGGDPRTSPASQTLHDDPLIEVFPAFLTTAECRFLIDCTRSEWQPAVVVDPRSGQLIRDPVRTAHSAGLPFVKESPAIHAINRRIAAATGTTYEQGEPAQVLAYAPRQEYKLHHDTIAGAVNQRAGTFLVTLADAFTGGETAFPNLGITFRGNIGDALYFRSVDRAGRIDGRMVHAGLPVQSGIKILLSKWLRERPLDLSGPMGRPL